LSLADLVVDEALRAVARDAGESVSDYQSVWLSEEGLDEADDALRAIRATAGDLVRAVLPAAAARLTDAIPLSARSALTGASLAESTVWMSHASDHALDLPPTPEKALPPPKDTRWLELEGILRAEARRAAEDWLAQIVEDDVCEVQSQDTASPLPEPQRLAIAERELLDAEAVGLQGKVQAFVACLQAAGFSTEGAAALPDLPEAAEFPHFFAALRNATFQLQDAQQKALETSAARDSELAALEAKTAELAAAHAATAELEVAYTEELAKDALTDDERSHLLENAEKSTHAGSS
jgi:hypothetical protein